MHLIAELSSGPRSLHVTWDDGTITAYPWIWLRDHAHDLTTLHPTTLQRELFTATVPRDLAPAEVRIADGVVVVRWTDPEHSDSALPLPFLAAHRVARPAVAGVDVEPALWDTARIEPELPFVRYEDVMADDDGVVEWLRLTTRFGFCLALGTPATPEATEALLRRAAYIRETIFGGAWTFTSNGAMADSAYSTVELRPHTDGTYAHDAPGAQLLHCLDFDGEGGASTMVDGFAVAARLQNEHPDHHETLSRVVVPGQYIGDGAHLMAARPVLRHDHTGSLAQVSFNNYDRAPFLLPEDEMIAFYDALRAFDLIVNDRSMQWRHVLAPGEAMLFDNWRVLHGRTAFTGRRVLSGGYLNREDVESRLRLGAVGRRAPASA